MDEDEEDDVLSMESGGKSNDVIVCSQYSAQKESGLKWWLLTMLSWQLLDPPCKMARKEGKKEGRNDH